MGVDFAHLLISHDNGYRPTPRQVADLAKALQDRGYVPTPGSPGHRAARYETTDEPYSLFRWGFSLARALGRYVEPQANPPLSDLEGLPEYLLSWSVHDPVGSGLAFPLEGPPPASHAYYDVQVLSAEDFIAYDAGGLVDPLDTRCACGAELGRPGPENDPFYANRIAVRCDRCGREFRPQDQVVNYFDPITGEPSPLRGGVCFRFAIRIQAGKGLNPLPRIDGRLPRATPAFLALCEQALGQPLYEVGYLY